MSQSPQAHLGTMALIFPETGTLFCCLLLASCFNLTPGLKIPYQVRLTQIDSFKTGSMKSGRSKPDIIIMPKESVEELLTSHMHHSNEEVNEMMSKILGDLEPVEVTSGKQLASKSLHEINAQKKQNIDVDYGVSQKKMRLAPEKKRKPLKKRRKRFILVKPISKATRNGSWISRKYNRTQICMIENEQTINGKMQEQVRNIKFRNQKQTPKCVKGKAKNIQILKYTKDTKNRKANWRKKNLTHDAKKEKMLILKERRKREIYIQKRVNVFKNPVDHYNLSNYLSVYFTPGTVQSKLSKRLKRKLLGCRRNTRETSLNNFLQRFGDFLKHLPRHRTLGNEKVTGIDISIKIKKSPNNTHFPIRTQKPNLNILILSKSTARPPVIMSFTKDMGRPEKKRTMSHMNSWKTPHSVTLHKIKHNFEHKFRFNTFKTNDQHSILKTKDNKEIVKQIKKIEKGMAERPIESKFQLSLGGIKNEQMKKITVSKSHHTLVNVGLITTKSPIHSKFGSTIMMSTHFKRQKTSNWHRKEANIASLVNHSKLPETVKHISNNHKNRLKQMQLSHMHELLRELKIFIRILLQQMQKEPQENVKLLNKTSEIRSKTP